MTDCLEQQGMERVVQQYLGSKGTDLDLKQQFALYEVSRAPTGSGVAVGRAGARGVAEVPCPVPCPPCPPQPRPLRRALSSWRMAWKNRPRGDGRNGGGRTRVGVGGDPKVAARSPAPMPSHWWGPLAP